MPAISIRLAVAADLEAINAIYNHYVPISTTTFDVAPMSAADRRKWFQGRGAPHPVTVACDGPSVVGWGSLHPFRLKHGYRFTVENSVYVHHDRQRQGIGSLILRDQIERARQLGLHAIVAGIDSSQDASLRLHARHGFVEVARFPQIGFKFDQWLDVVFMQLTL
jgi:phosphinothricin acetyltransferase